MQQLLLLSSIGRSVMGRDLKLAKHLCASNPLALKYLDTSGKFPQLQNTTEFATTLAAIKILVLSFEASSLQRSPL